MMFIGHKKKKERKGLSVEANSWISRQERIMGEREEKKSSMVHIQCQNPMVDGGPSVQVPQVGVYWLFSASANGCIPLLTNISEK